MQRGESLLPDSQGRSRPPGSSGNLQTPNSPCKHVLPHFLPAPILRKGPRSLGGVRGRRGPGLQGGPWACASLNSHNLGWFTKNTGNGPRLTHLQRIPGCFLAFAETFLWKTRRDGAGRESRLCGRRPWPGEAVLQPGSCMSSKRVPGTTGRGGAGSGQTAAPPPPEEVPPGSPRPSNG